MSAPRIMLACLPSVCENYHNWRKVDKFLTKKNLHSNFSNTVYITVLENDYFSHEVLFVVISLVFKAKE